MTEGGIAYMVGGPVRDGLLGKAQGKDIDLLICKIPFEKLKQFLSRRGEIYLVGQSFGVIKFKPSGDGRVIDISLPRKERSTGTGHRDFAVDFDPDIPLEVDLGRRDFTINAMARDCLTGELIDPFGGRKDLADRVLRMISPSGFSEDPLRMMRGVQFMARLQLTVQPDTEKSMTEQSHLINSVAAERLAEELNKLLLAENPSPGFRLMQRTGLLRQVLPEIETTVGVTQPGGYHRWDVFEHTLQTIDNAPLSLPVRLAALFHDCGKPATKVDTDSGASFYGHDRLGRDLASKALKRLRYAGDIIETVCILVEKHMFSENAGEKGIRRLISKVGIDKIYDLIDLRKADTLAQGMGQTIDGIEEFRARVKAEIEKKSAFGLKDLQIDGNDIKNLLGIGEGPLVGVILNELFEQVLDEPALNDRQKLMQLAREIFRKRQLDK